MSFASEAIEKETWENIDRLDPDKIAEHCHQEGMFEISEIIAETLRIMKERVLFLHHYPELNK